MIASDVSFEQMRLASRNLEGLGVAAGFVHTSDNYGQTFRTKKAVCLEFETSLNEYLEYLGESIPVSLGS